MRRTEKGGAGGRRGKKPKCEMWMTEATRGGPKVVWKNKSFFKNQKHEPNIVEITHLCIMHGAHTIITYSKARVMKPTNEASLKSVRLVGFPWIRLAPEVGRMKLPLKPDVDEMKPSSDGQSPSTGCLMKLPLNPSRDPSGRTVSSSIPSSVYLQQPLIRPVIQPDCLFFGWVCFVAAVVFFWVDLFLWQQQW